jgi:hypothetical protein
LFGIKITIMITMKKYFVMGCVLLLAVTSARVEAGGYQLSITFTGYTNRTDYADYNGRTESVSGFFGQGLVGFTPLGVPGGVRDFTAAWNDVSREGLGWRTGSGLVLSGIAFAPGGDFVREFEPNMNSVGKCGVVQLLVCPRGLL